MTDRKDEIARVAWAIWEAEGRPDGRDVEHWRRATEMVDRGETVVEPVPAPGTREDLGDLRAEPGGAFERTGASEHPPGSRGSAVPDASEPADRHEPGGAKPESQ